MSERDEILKNNRSTSGVSSSLPKTRAGFLITFIANNIQAFSRFIHKWGKP